MIPHSDRNWRRSAEWSSRIERLRAIEDSCRFRAWKPRNSTKTRRWKWWGWRIRCWRCEKDWIISITENHWNRKRAWFNERNSKYSKRLLYWAFVFTFVKWRWSCVQKEMSAWKFRKAWVLWRVWTRRLFKTFRQDFRLIRI